MIRRRVNDEDDLLPAESQDLDVIEGRGSGDEQLEGHGDEPAEGRFEEDDERGVGVTPDRLAAAGGEHGAGETADESSEAPDLADGELERDLGTEGEASELEAIENPNAAVPDFPEDPSEEDLARLRKTLEAVLFASTESLTPSRLAEVLRVSIDRVKAELQVLEDELDVEQRPYELRAHGGAWRLYTRETYYPYLLRLKSLKKVEKLTPAALETLAIVAYRQPVIRAEIEAIRGVRSGPLLRALLDRKLIRVLGRAGVPGAPLQYGTTQRFLDRFGLPGLKDLPSLKEFRQGRI